MSDFVRSLHHHQLLAMLLEQGIAYGCFCPPVICNRMNFADPLGEPEQVVDIDRIEPKVRKIIEASVVKIVHTPA